jgi:hypothetical protein
LTNADPVVAPRTCLRQNNSDQLEVLFAHGMWNAIMNLQRGARSLSGWTGVPEATLRSLRKQITRDHNWRPWRIRSIHADRRTFITR